MKISSFCSTRAIAQVAVAVAVCLQLAACSTYTGKITNAPQPAGLQGPPGLTDDFAP